MHSTRTPMCVYTVAQQPSCLLCVFLPNCLSVCLSVCLQVVHRLGPVDFEQSRAAGGLLASKL